MRALLKILRRIFGTQQIAYELKKMQEHLRTQGRDLVHLPACEYARYAVPLDYPPARIYAPRYGYSHPPIERLVSLFQSHEPSYLEMLRYMASLDVRHIPESGSLPAWTGGAISRFDALLLYAMVHKYRPRIYLEIGSGMTTYFAKQATKDAGLDTKIISIDPEPRAEVSTICDKIYRSGLEEIDQGVFDELQPGDIVFMDGSHRCFMNSDVTIFFIETLPRLKPGVLVHVHDVFLPYDYIPLFKDWYWNEQYMLAVYMMNNRSVVPLFPGTYVRENCITDFPGTVDSGSLWFTHQEAVS
jgi:hypothetical protein